MPPLKARNGASASDPLAGAPQDGLDLLSQEPTAQEPTGQEGDPAPVAEPPAAPVIEPEPEPAPAPIAEPAPVVEPVVEPAPAVVPAPVIEAAPVVEEAKVVAPAPAIEPSKEPTTQEPVTGLVRLQPPNGVTSCGIDGAQYDVVDGFVHVLEHHVAHLIERGFSFVKHLIDE